MVIRIKMLDHHIYCMLPKLLIVEHCLSGIVDKRSKSIKARARNCHRTDVALICRHYKKVTRDRCSEQSSQSTDQNADHHQQFGHANGQLPPPPSESGHGGFPFGQGGKRRRRKRQSQISEVFEYTLSPDKWGVLDSRMSISKFYKQKVFQQVSI